MTLRTKLMTAGLATGLCMITIVGVASAQGGSPGTTLVDDLATKFHLNKTDVQQVFDAHHQAQMAKGEAKSEERLTQAVKDGRITEAQKALILAKHKEMIANREAARMADPGKRHTDMEQQRDDLKVWADQNKIPLDLTFGFGGRGGHGMHPMGGVKMPANQE